MHPVIPPRLFVLNRNKLCKMLKKGSVAITHSNDEMPRNGDQYFPFRQNSDLYYLTGINQEKTILMLCPDHPVAKNREILFIIRPDTTLEIWHGKKLTRSEASLISGVSNVVFIDEFHQYLNEIVYSSEIIYLNMMENPRFPKDIASRDQRYAQNILDQFPLHTLERLQPLLINLRLLKEPEEINIIRHACNITGKAFTRVLNYIKPGVYEYEVEAEISHEFRINKSDGHAYYPIIASGENACILHYVSNDSQCKDGELLMIDFGAEFSNYASDCSRTLPVNGRFTKRQKDLYDATLRVFNKTRTIMVKGTSIGLINKQVGQFWEEEHVQLGLYSMNDLRQQNPETPLYAKYFMHGVSHFMGLDVHDVGSRSQILEPGMILTCEPGIYIQEENIGIRIENNILITEDEPIDLMQNIPIETEEIEEIMNKKTSR